MSTQDYFCVPFNRTRANAIYTDGMSRMYGPVALGVITTGATKWIGDLTDLGEVFYSLGWIGWQDIYNISVFFSFYLSNR